MIGATSGIGYSMAQRLIKEGVKVTAVGRRQDRLNAFVSDNGSDKASSEVFDISKLDSIPSFVQRYAAKLPLIKSPPGLMYQNLILLP